MLQGLLRLWISVMNVSFPSVPPVQPSLYLFVKCKHLEFLCVCVQGYSFMAPSILFKRNVVMDDPVQLCGGSERPGSAAVARSAMMKVRWMDLDPHCTNTLELMPAFTDRWDHFDRPLLHRFSTCFTALRFSFQTPVCLFHVCSWMHNSALPLHATLKIIYLFIIIY